MANSAYERAVVSAIVATSALFWALAVGHWINLRAGLRELLAGLACVVAGLLAVRLYSPPARHEFDSSFSIAEQVIVGVLMFVTGLGGGFVLPFILLNVGKAHPHSSPWTMPSPILVIPLSLTLGLLLGLLGYRNPSLFYRR